MDDLQGMNEPSSGADNRFGLTSVLVCLISACLILIPLIEALGRRIAGISIPGALNWVHHLVLWLGLLGGILATRRKQQLAIAALQTKYRGKSSAIFDLLTTSSTLAFLMILTAASAVMVRAQMHSPETLGGWLPVWIAQSVMPVSFLFMAIATVKTGAGKRRHPILSALIAGIICLILVIIPDAFRPAGLTPLLFVILFLAFMGMPLYAALGGISFLLFSSSGIPIAALPSESYRIMTQPVLPSIPLFALSGAILAAGGAPRRLIRLVTAWTGWMRGGTAITTVLGCALFTAVTGASGVTILALGGLLLPLLIATHYKEQFAVGLLTASGSVGLLLPPSLPVILYGIYGHVAIDRLFKAALFPGILLVFLLSMTTFFVPKSGSKPVRRSFSLDEALKALWTAKGDLLLPVIIMVGLFGGIFTLVETAALTVLWAILLETVFHRKLTLKEGIPKAISDASVLVGALFMVLSFASGLMAYIVDAQIPFLITDWIIRVVQSKYLFLLALNVILIIVGMFMDIFSAIVIAVPIIVPVGVAFQVDPVHLGIVFLANLELGYLTPPVGMNLFLSSLSFHKPLIEIWRLVIPFLVIFIIWVLIITYIPFISVGMAQWLLN